MNLDYELNAMVLFDNAANSKPVAQEGQTSETCSISKVVTPEKIEKVVDSVAAVSMNLLIALVIFIVGKWLAAYVANFAKKAVLKTTNDQELAMFARATLKYLCIVIVCCIALGKLGLQTSSIVAMLGTAGLAIGLALQGSLANFAAGTLIIVFRPFRIGDYIEGAGTSGSVVEIGILTTVLNTPDNKRIIIPNSSLMSSPITNYSTNSERRVDFCFGISYDSSIDKAREIIETIFNKDERVLKDEAMAATIFVGEMADNSVNLVARAWVKKEHYWNVFFSVQEAVKKEFDANGIEIPFPQRDIRVHYVKDSEEGNK